MTGGNGWVKIHRKLTDWEWFTERHMARLFLYLLLSANHKPKKWRGTMVGVGQLITGRKALALKTGVSEQSIRTCLARFVSTGEITIKSTNKYSIITICNYSTYQIVENGINQQLTSNQPTTNQQSTTNKKVKNVKKEKKRTIIPDIFPITNKMREWFNKQNFKHIAIEPATEQFIDYWKSEGKLKADWLATWRNGIKRQEKWDADKPGEDKSWQL